MLAVLRTFFSKTFRRGQDDALVGKRRMLVRLMEREQIELREIEALLVRATALPSRMDIGRHDGGASALAVTIEDQLALRRDALRGLGEQIAGLRQSI